MQRKKRYPVGVQDFGKIREGNYYYVDKTDIIYDLVHEYDYVFMSRPRRFGKSLLVSTLACYFEGKRELFQGLAMEQLEEEWKVYPVVHLSFASVKEVEIEKIRSVVDFIIAQQEKKFALSCTSTDFASRMTSLIKGCYEKYGEKVVVLVDEYDSPLLNVLNDKVTLDQVRQLMRSVFAPLKDCGYMLQFLFITGITKFSQLSVFSELNNLRNISMKPQFATLCGITQDEMERDFGLGIQVLQDAQGMTRDEVLEKLKFMYDGYHFSRGTEGVYNPFSLMNALEDQDFKQYWFSTGTPSFLVGAMKRFNTDVTRIDGEWAMSTQFDAPTEDMQSVLPLFYQSGYLTIKDFDKESERYLLGYPNNEVRLGMNYAFLPYYVSPDTDTALDYAWKISKPLRDGDVEKALYALQAYLKKVPYQEYANSEGHYTSMLYVIFTMLGIYVESQVRTSDGRIDVVLKTKRYVYVIELKMDRDAQEALAQIDSKDYALTYSLDGREVVKVGLSFSTYSRTLSDWVIKM